MSPRGNCKYCSILFSLCKTLYIANTTVVPLSRPSRKFKHQTTGGTEQLTNLPRRHKARTSEPSLSVQQHTRVQTAQLYSRSSTRVQIVRTRSTYGRVQLYLPGCTQSNCTSVYVARQLRIVCTLGLSPILVTIYSQSLFRLELFHVRSNDPVWFLC